MGGGGESVCARMREVGAKTSAHSPSLPSGSPPANKAAGSSVFAMAKWQGRREWIGLWESHTGLSLGLYKGQDPHGGDVFE